jgi:hypothetical protein
MTTLSYGPPTATARAWRWWQWTLLVLGTLVATVVSGVATLVTVFAVGTTCDDAATMSTVREGQFWLLAVAVGAALPGGLAALLLGSGRLRWVISAGVAATPPLFALVTMTSPADWTGTSFCF